jgi:hypothetical protein
MFLQEDVDDFKVERYSSSPCSDDQLVHYRQTAAVALPVLKTEPEV